MRAMRRGTGHVVVSLNKRGQVSRVNCPRCGVNTAFKKGKTPTGARASTKDSAPYDWTRTYQRADDGASDLRLRRGDGGHRYKR